MEIGELFENAINNWRDKKGIGTAIIPSKLNDKIMVLGVLQRVYARSPTVKTLIITSNFTERNDIIEFLTQQNDADENNKEFKSLIQNKSIKLLTASYVERFDVHDYPLLCILYHIDNLGECCFKYLVNSKFKLVVLSNLLTDASDMTKLYRYCPLLSDFKEVELEKIRMSIPIEEERIGIVLDEDSEDKKLLDYYNEYITTSINIFGSFDIMQQANVGNSKLNISASQICNSIAYENGWNEHLDMSVQFNIDIDNLYNPMNLKERASQTYEIIRKRSQLLSDYKGKLDIILDIVKRNSNKRILIINKRADFANEITSYLNTLSETNICMNFHDKVNDIPAVDLDNNPVYYKTGVNKGKRKSMGAKAQKTYAIAKFNRNEINIISTNNLPDKDLNITVDIIIITSPMCEDIKNYIYRLSNLKFASNKIELYTLFCKSTMEEKLIEKKDLTVNHVIKNANTDEIFSNFVIAD